MSASAPSPRHDYVLRAIDAHFGGRISVSTEKAMRAHLPACPSCSEEYERHLIVAQLDPRALPAEQRIGNALGFRKQLLPPWARRGARVVVPVGAAAAFALLAVAGVHQLRGERQTAAPAEPAVSIGEPIPPPSDGRFMFTITGTRRGGPVRVIDADEKLGFSYTNPGKKHLMILGADEHGHVFWFFPIRPGGESRGRRPATARWDRPSIVVQGRVRSLSPNIFSDVPAVGPGTHQLPFKIGYPFDGEQLKVFALWSDVALLPSRVESFARELSDGGKRMPFGLGGVVIVRKLQVLQPTRRGPTVTEVEATAPKR
jgi:hypothetical protein